MLFWLAFFFGQVKFLKSASRFLAKVFVTSVQAFLSGSFFLAKKLFSKFIFFSIGFSKSWALAFFQAVFVFNSKVGLVNNCRACKIKSLKGWVLVFRRCVLLAPVLANKACT